jgi:hypothetical protein
MAVQHLIKGEMTKDYLVALWRDAMATEWGLTIVKIESRWIKAHTSNRDRASYVNNWADMNARKGLMQARKGRSLLKLGV